MALGFGSGAATWNGYNEQKKKEEEGRAAKRKAMQELVDKASLQGRNLTLEDMLGMAESSGAMGDMMLGNSFSGSMLSQIQSTSNAQAADVAAKREFEETTRNYETMDRVKKVAAEQWRTHRDPVKVMQAMEGLFPKDVLGKASGVISSIGQEVDQADFIAGSGLVDRFSTQQEAEQYITSLGLTGKRAEGLRQGWKAKQLQLESKVDEIAMRYGANIDESDPNKGRRITQLVESLPPELQHLKDRYRKGLESGSSLGVSARNIELGQTWGKAAANAAPGMAEKAAGFGVAEAALRQQRSQDFLKEEEQRIGASAAGIAAELAAFSKKDFKGERPSPEGMRALQQLAGAASAYSLEPATVNQLRNLAFAGKAEDFARELKRVTEVAPSAARLRERAVIVSQLRAGDFQVDTPQQVKEVFERGGNALLSLRAAELMALQRDMKGYLDPARPNPAEAKKAEGRIAEVMAERIRGLRTSLLESGRLSMPPEEIKGREYALLQQWGAEFSGVVSDPGALIQRVIAAAGEPVGLVARPGASGVFSGLVAGSPFMTAPGNGASKWGAAPPSPAAPQGAAYTTGPAAAPGGDGGGAPTRMPSPPPGFSLTSTPGETDKRAVLRGEHQRLLALAPMVSGPDEANRLMLDLKALEAEGAKIGLSLPASAASAPLAARMQRQGGAPARNAPASSGVTWEDVASAASPPPPRPARGAASQTLSRPAAAAAREAEERAANMTVRYVPRIGAFTFNGKIYRSESDAQAAKRQLLAQSPS